MLRGFVANSLRIQPYEGIFIAGASASCLHNRCATFWTTDSSALFLWLLCWDLEACLLPFVKHCPTDKDTAAVLYLGISILSWCYVDRVCCCLSYKLVMSTCLLLRRCYGLSAALAPNACYGLHGDWRSEKAHNNSERSL